ncbi:MAG: sirohydrochlorin cobaltochelatase [Odoribacter sp.]|nr:sirohydrochlorin cobaltochelatase [Odoribacter sp.]
MKWMILFVSMVWASICRAHSDENFVASGLFENLGPRDKAAVLMVHFGTTYNDTRALTIDVINAKMKEAFPGVELREAWTSRIILRKLKARNIERSNPAEALIRLHEEGYTHILVQSTNIIEGMEMKELRREVESLSLNFKDIRIGNPLLYTPEDYETVAAALTGTMDKAFPGGQKLLVGHGTPDPATASYAMFDYLLKATGHPFWHVATIEGYPSFDNALRLLKAAKARTVTLAPLMFVAGDHAKNDIAGDWKEELEKQGFKVNLYLKGLGEHPAVQDLFVSHARFAAGHKAVDMKTKKAAYRIGKE